MSDEKAMSGENRSDEGGGGAAPDVVEQLGAQAGRVPLGRRLLRVGLLVAVLAVVFGWFLPNVVGVDYASVWDTVRTLTIKDGILLTALVVPWIVLEATVSKTVSMGLPIRTAIMAWLGPNAVISSGAPPGTDIDPVRDVQVSVHA